MENLIWVLCTLLTCTPVIHCEYPVTPALLPENIECNGTTAMFNWTYSSETPDPTSVTWTKRNSNGTLTATLATFAFEKFTVDPNYTGRVTRAGTTGQIELSNIQSTDEGIYRIEVVYINDSITTNGTGNLILLEPPNGSLMVTTGVRSLGVSGLTSLGFPAATVICKNEQNEIYVNRTPCFFLRNVPCGTYTCCVESLTFSKCGPSSDPSSDQLRTCQKVVVDDLDCKPSLIVGISLLAVGIVITGMFVKVNIVQELKHEVEVEERFQGYFDDLVQKPKAENGRQVWNITGKAKLILNQTKGKCQNGTLEIKFKLGGHSDGAFEITFEHSNLSVVQHPKNTIFVPDLKDPKEVEASFGSYLRKHFDDVVQKSDAENGHKVWTIKGGEAHLSLNPPKGKVNVKHSKNTIYVPDLTNPKEVEASFKKYLKKHFDDVVKKSTPENGRKVWTIKGGEAQLSLNPPKGKVNGTLEIKFKQSGLSIVQHPKNTILVPDLTNQEEVEASCDSYVRKHYDVIEQKSNAKNGHKVWTIKGGKTHIRFIDPPKREVKVKVKADKLRLVNFIYSIIHCAAGLIMMIITDVLACKPLVGFCIGGLVISILNLLYGIGNIILTLTWENKSYGWFRWDFGGGSETTTPEEISCPTHEPSQPPPPRGTAFEDFANSQPTDCASVQLHWVGI